MLVRRGPNSGGKPICVCLGRGFGDSGGDYLRTLLGNGMASVGDRDESGLGKGSRPAVAVTTGEDGIALAPHQRHRHGRECLPVLP